MFDVERIIRKVVKLKALTKMNSIAIQDESPLQFQASG